MIVGGIYGAREAASHGYLTAVMFNEIAGRYVQGFSGHVQSPLYYLPMLSHFFAFGPAFALPFLAAALPWPRTKSAAFLTYANCVSLAFIVVYSIGRTRIAWYMEPVYPILSISFALSLGRLAKLVGRINSSLQVVSGAAAGRIFGSVVAAALCAAGTMSWMYMIKLPSALDLPQGRYGLVFAQLHRQGRTTVRTLDSGVQNNGGMRGYTPQLRFYALVWEERGMKFAAADPDRRPALVPDAVLVTCDPRELGPVSALGRSYTSVGGCAAVAAQGSAGSADAGNTQIRQSTKTVSE